MTPKNVVTFGRSSQNNVVLNDSLASRVHCQIIQFDDGSFAIADFNSTNGTYVNGVRINEQIPLTWNDSVQIANTPIAWQQYFGTETKRRTSLWVWPIVAASAALFVITALLLVFGLHRHYDDREILYSGLEPPISMLTLEENGVSYSIEAAEGQMVVMFDETVSHKEAIKILRNNHAKIVAQIPDVLYYLVEVPSGKEGELFSSLRDYVGVDYIFPNAVESICSVTAHLIDNFNDNHGDKVASMMKGCYPLMDVESHDIGIGDGEHINSYKAHRDFKKIISNLAANESAVINMSFGPALKLEKKRPLWNDFDVTNAERANYIYAYSHSLESYVKQAKRFDDRDFVIVHSAGNEGMKGMEVVFESLRESLSSEEYAVFERHFILVSAKDDNKEGDYPNDVRNYNKMVTKVDISDMTAQDLHWQGTSFSAPRAASFISSIASEHNMKVTEVLGYAREATRLHPEHLLTPDKLDSLIKADRNVKFQLSDSTQGLIGTMWKSVHGHDDDYTVLRFDGESNGTVLWFFLGESGVITHFHFYYEKEYNGWCIYDWGKNKMYFKIDGNKLYMGFYRPRTSSERILDPSIYIRI